MLGWLTPEWLLLFLIFIYPTMVVVYNIFDPNEHRENTESILRIFKKASERREKK